MFLRSLAYSEFKGKRNEWRIEGFDISNINLIVGKNAVGKTRTLSAIFGLASILSGRAKLIFQSGEYYTTFDLDGRTIKYILKFNDTKVFYEEFIENGNQLLIRKKGGKGKIFAKAEKKYIHFQSPENQLAVVSRRDSIQHSFLQPLYDWAIRTRKYSFGGQFGKKLFVNIDDKLIENINDYDDNQTVGIFIKGMDQYKKAFEKAIIKDMISIGYNLVQIGVTSPEGMIPKLPRNLVCIAVKEKEIYGPINQLFLSQGMFRALAVIIHINYLLFSRKPSCILLDDIGEGLDFDRSCRLIDLIINKALKTSIQVIMTTNDRFTMNKTPLQYWSIMSRRGGVCKFYNYQNSRKVFEEFKFTGLNNFDFFATDYIAKIKNIK